MTQTSDIVRPSKELIEGLSHISSATATGELSRLGVRNAQITGPRSWAPGKAVVGPALTLQFLPKREDLYGESEYTDPEKQLHRHVLYHTQPGDIVVFTAFGGGLTWGSAVVRWGDRTTPIAESDAELPPTDRDTMDLLKPNFDFFGRPEKQA